MSTETQPPIVVGIDGSNSAKHAVDWAAKEAAKRNLPLRIVHATASPVSGYTTQLGPPEGYFAILEEEGRAHLRYAAERAAKVAPNVDIATMLERTHPVWTLVRHSEHAKLVVVGSRGMNSLEGALLGSIAAGVLARGHCPVAVIRGPQGSGPVVLGIDGSPTSETATAWAFDEASLRETDLLAVHTWTDYVSDTAYARASLLVTDWSWMEEEQAEILAERLAGWQEKYPDVTVRKVVARDRPAHHLIEQATNAQLLVVGSRGRGGFTGMLLGSTSRKLIYHAPCPVLIARPSEH